MKNKNIERKRVKKKLKRQNPQNLPKKNGYF